MKGLKQTTLGDTVSISGIGVHSAAPATMTLRPAKADTGIIFVRTGQGRVARRIQADVRAVTATEFATVLGDATGPLCSTTEHILAALRGLAIDNVVVEVDGPEAPIMDGSAQAFVDAIDRAGIETLDAPRRFIEVLKTIRVDGRNGAFGELRPNARGFRIEAAIEFDDKLIGRQTFSGDIDSRSFRRDLARARTFGFMRDVSTLWGAGYALGASFENTIVLNESGVLNPGGLRCADEFVRHKALDAVGDLGLAGAPLLATYRSMKAGHKMNFAVLSALMADTSAWRWVDAAPAPRRAVAGRGQGLGRKLGHVELGVGLAAPAYGPAIS